MSQATPLALGDRMDFSPQALLAAAQDSLASRAERVIAIRQAIARDEYEDEQKLTIAIGRLLSELIRDASPLAAEHA